MRAVEAWPLAHQMIEASYQQSGADQQDDAKCDLDGDHDPSRPGSAAPAMVAPESISALCQGGEEECEGRV